LVLNLKFALISAFTVTFYGLVTAEKSFADYVPPAFIESVKEKKDLTTDKSVTGYGKFIMNHNPKLPKKDADKIAVNVTKFSNEHNVDPKLVLALMARESSFRSNVVSKSGAIGLGQLKMATARDMGVKNPFNIIENIKGTVKYISWLLKRSDGDVDMTLASYYLGFGAVSRAKTAGQNLPEKVEKYVADIKNFHSMI
jgi:soluble lytic murein transglycosylase-like protein